MTPKAIGSRRRSNSWETASETETETETGSGNRYKRIKPKALACGRRRKIQGKLLNSRSSLKSLAPLAFPRFPCFPCAANLEVLLRRRTLKIFPRFGSRVTVRLRMSLNFMLMDARMHLYLHFQNAGQPVEHGNLKGDFPLFLNYFKSFNLVISYKLSCQSYYYLTKLL